MTYVCRVIDHNTEEKASAGAEGNQKIKQADLTKEISVIVNILSPETVENITDQLVLKVNINDKISKIPETYALMNEDRGGFLTHSNKMISNPEDITFAKIFSLNNGKFGLSCGGGSSKPPVMWHRFKGY